MTDDHVEAPRQSIATLIKDPPDGTGPRLRVPCIEGSMKTGSREQQLRYLVVGGFNTVFGVGVFAALDLTTARYVGHYVVLTCAAVISVATAHTTQRKWAWLSHAPYFRELARFSSVYLVGYLLNLALLYAAHSGFGAPVIPTQVAITGLLISGTFFVHRFWTFAPTPRPRREE